MWHKQTLILCSSKHKLNKEDIHYRHEWKQNRKQGGVSPPMISSFNIMQGKGGDKKL